MILNFGALEILAIVMLTLIVFGPERLPVLLGQFGRAIKKFRDWYVVLAANIRTELEPVQDELKEIRQVAAEVQSDLADIRNAVDIRAMLPSMNVSAELGTPPSGDIPELALPPEFAPTKPAPVPSNKRDENLAADNPWSGPALPQPNPPDTADAKLGDDNPWSKA